MVMQVDNGLRPINPEVDLSICLVNVNARELTLQCLRSIYDYTSGIRFEVIVVDNASTDGSAEQIKRAFPSVQIIRVPQLQGFSSNSNLAIRQGVARYVLVLNNDTTIHDDAFTGLVTFMDEHPACGAAGCQLRNPDGTLQFVSARRKRNLYTYVCIQLLLQETFPKSRLFGREYLPYPQYFGPPIEVDVLSGACMVVRREVLETVGLLDEEYYLYCEDIDWSLRIKQAGWQIYYVPHISVTHLGNQTISKTRVRGRIEEYRSLVRYFRKFRAVGSITLAFIRLVRVISLLERMLLWGFLYLHPDKRETARQNIRACWEVIMWHFAREKQEIADISVVPIRKNR